MGLVINMKEIIKLVLVDIDGTLLDSNHRVSQRTVEAISKLEEHGILFGIATGRTPFAVRHLVSDWNIAQYTDLIMGFNGGCTLNMKNNQLDSCYLLDGKYIREIKEDFKAFKINMALYDEESCHALWEDERVLGISKGNKIEFVVDDLTGYETKQINKLLFVGTKEQIDECEAYYNEHIHTSHYRAVRSTPTLLEFLNPDLSKSKGIEVICDHLGITMENVLTFGDELNDLEMIRDCVGVAMGNANPKIKEIARYITDSNNDSGIATFLEENIL